MAHTLGIVFSPLNLSKDEIRFVRLLPQLSEEIECELIQVNLSSNPRYEALSYEWGPVPKDPFWITVNGTPFQVRQNLSEALRALRLPSEPRLLWIDALCINQDDMMERNHQVGKMGEIYRNARRVIIWLGSERYGQYDTDDAIRAISFLEDTKRMSIGNFVLRGSRTLELLTKGYDRIWQSVLHLCQRTYWTRLWIIQEVVLATNIIVHCGQLKTTWDVLSRLFAELKSCSGFEIGNSLLRSVPARLDEQRLTRRKSEQGSILLDMVFINEHASCENVRDKVFGLHSLVRDCCRKEVPIDYSKTPIELCNDVLQHDFLRHRSTGYDYFRSTSVMQGIMTGSWAEESSRGLDRWQNVLWPKAREGDVMVVGRIVEVPGLDKLRYISSDRSHAMVPFPPTGGAGVKSDGLISKATRKIDEFRKRSETITEVSVGKKERHWVAVQKRDVVCNIEGCDFYVVFRHERFPILEAGETVQEFRILGVRLKTEMNDMTTTEEYARISLDVITLQKLCLTNYWL